MGHQREAEAFLGGPAELLCLGWGWGMTQISWVLEKEDGEEQHKWESRGKKEGLTAVTVCGSS